MQEQASTYTSTLDAIPDVRVDITDAEGNPIVGNDGATCDTVAMDPDNLCEIDFGGVLLPQIQCVICGGDAGVDVPA